MRVPECLALMLSVCAGAAGAETKTFELTVAAGPRDRLNTPIRAALVVPKALQDARAATLQDAAGKALAAQITPPVLLETLTAPEGSVVRGLEFILPALKAGETATLKATVSTEPPPPAAGFKWHDTAGDFAELRFDARPVMRYMYKEIGAGPARALTYKVFHHLYDPAGKRLVTKGPGGEYTHHRGIFYGFKCTYEGTTVDTWHCTGDTHLGHAGFLRSDAGPVLGRHLVKVEWHGAGKKVFANEERELTAYNVPGGTLVEFSSRLRSTGGTVKVGGDPQHAGFHFRADNEVAATTKNQTYYVRPDGAGKPGETRNWPGQKTHANLPWDAMSFVLGTQRYTVAYLDRPENPKEARFSERDYGRFGSYFETEFDEKKTLDVRYRLWLQEGEMTVEQVAASSADFVDPPKVTVK